MSNYTERGNGILQDRSLTVLPAHALPSKSPLFEITGLIHNFGPHSSTTSRHVRVPIFVKDASLFRVHSYDMLYKVHCSAII